jgi:predicted nucleic acid-binding protein
LVVVDTSVWVDVLRGADSPAAARAIELIEDGAPVALTDIILTELRQGLGSDRDAELVEQYLRAFPFLRLETLEDFSLAAELYRTARKAGVTIRNTMDCLIAAPCVRTGAPLLHSDADFDRLASCTRLRVFN